MEQVERLGYVGTTTSSMDDWRDFAVSVLGLEISPESTDDLLLLRVDDHHHRLSIRSGDSDDIDHVGWELADAGQITVVRERLTERGIDVHDGTTEEAELRCVLEFVWFDCPFTGVRTELFVGPEKLFQPPFRPTRTIGTFVTGDRGLGHIVLYAPELAEAEAFYAQVLGFATSDRVLVPGMGQLAAFMHCNARHHSLGLMAIPGTPRRLQHIMLEAADIDTVGTTYDLCVEREITSTSLGRHLNDHTFSFYFRTPSGWHVEYGWNSRTIDPSTWQIEHYNGLRPQGEWGHVGLTSMI